MKLGQMDASGRAGVTETVDVVEVPATAVIVAVGERLIPISTCQQMRSR